MAFRPNKKPTRVDAEPTKSIKSRRIVLKSKRLRFRDFDLFIENLKGALQLQYNTDGYITQAMFWGITP